MVDATLMKVNYAQNKGFSDALMLVGVNATLVMDVELYKGRAVSVPMWR